MPCSNWGGVGGGGGGGGSAENEDSSSVSRLTTAEPFLEFLAYANLF